MNKRCYTCKEVGHTKGECPNMKCRTCNERGHKFENCPVWKQQEVERLAAEKKRKREAQLVIAALLIWTVLCREGRQILPLLV